MSPAKPQHYDKIISVLALKQQQSHTSRHELHLFYTWKTRAAGWMRGTGIKLATQSWKRDSDQAKLKATELL